MGAWPVTGIEGASNPLTYSRFGTDSHQQPSFCGIGICPEKSQFARSSRACGAARRKENVINTQENSLQRHHRGDRPGKLFLVGIGPGSVQDRTPRAAEAISSCDVVVGYDPYVEAVRDLLTTQEVLTSGMMKETERCRAAINEALSGKKVCLISSGDAGVYGMAGLAMEMAAADNDTVDMEVVPGVTAANSAAALMGAPLMLDSATISLSDLLVPWELIVKRLEAVAAADLVVSLYNPRSKRRVLQLEEATRIMLQYRPGTTPVGIATAVGTEDQFLVLTDLDHLLGQEVGMRSIVIIGNSTTCLLGGRMVTPRGYYR